MADDNNKKKMGCGTFGLIILVGAMGLFWIQTLLEPKTQDTSTDTHSTTSGQNGIYTFALTHSMGQKLPSEAIFTCGNTPVWSLNFSSGNSLRYKIISADADGSLCGINARDNLGDSCELCIVDEGGGKITLRIRYSEKTMVFRGYAN